MSGRAGADRSTSQERPGPSNVEEDAATVTTMQSTSGAPEQPEVQDLEERLRMLEHQVLTLTVAVDAVSRLRIRTPLRMNHDIRIAGGKTVRRILEKGGLINGYPEVPGAD